jgi:predicted nucleic acid-binding protein
LSVGLVFDSWAILAYVQDEPSADPVEALLIDSARLKTGCITTVNLGEVWYMLARKQSHSFADRQVLELQSFGLERVDIDWPMVLQAAEFKSRYRISFADGFAAALAKQRNIELVTGDPEFRALESEIKIHWV